MPVTTENETLRVGYTVYDICCVPSTATLKLEGVKVMRLIQIVMVAVKLPSTVVTVIVDEPPPVAPPVTKADVALVAATVAYAVLDEVHVMAWLAALAGSTTASSVSCWLGSRMVLFVVDFGGVDFFFDIEGG